MKDTKYLSFLGAEKFLLTIRQSLAMMALFSGETAFPKGFAVPKNKALLPACAQRALVCEACLASPR